MIIGSKYVEISETLKQGIRTSRVIPLEKIADYNSCFFCSHRIEDGTKMFMVEFDTDRLTKRYFLDEDCYYKTIGARIYHDERRSRIYKDIILFFN